MKIKHLFLAATMLASAAVQAQDYPQNVVKIGLEGLTAAAIPLFPQINLHYERMITARQGANLMIGIGLPTKISDANIKSLNEQAAATSTNSNTNAITLNSGSLNSFEIVGEYRFYVSDQEGPRGFYLGPQLYYKNFNGKLTGSHIKQGTNSTIANDEIELNVNMLDLGVQFGAQWLIADKVSIDWMILGIGGGLNTATISGKTDDAARLDTWAADADNSISTDATLKSLGFVSGVVVDRPNGKLSLTTPIIPVYFRTGLAVGYAF